MKEFRGTPGEWTVQPPDPDDEVNPRYKWAIRAPGRGYVTSFQLAQLSSINRPEDEHDARLMAASKDLLEALQGMLAQFTKTPSSLKDSEARVKAHAAIAKALGEQS